MPIARPLRAACAAILAACVLPVQADGDMSTSLDIISMGSSGSISDTISSEDHPAGHGATHVGGPYRVIDIARAPGKADTTRLTMRSAGAPGVLQEFRLDVPDRVLAQRAIASGDLVQVNRRVYGYEFAYADTRQPFFLALQDAWYRELASRKVSG